MIDAAACSRELTVVVASTDGVALLYPAGVAAAALDATGRVVASIRGQVAEPRLVAVEDTDEGVRVRVRVAIAQEASARDVCARVYDLVRGHLGHIAVDSIEVRVGSIG